LSGDNIFSFYLISKITIDFILITSDIILITIDTILITIEVILILF